MPHFGLMDEKKLGPVAGPFQRSRLHLRSGKRRLREGWIAAGIVTLYDSVSGAMESYAADEQRRFALDVRPGEDLRSDGTLYAVLVRSGVLDGGFDFEGFERLMERALSEELPGFDYRPVLSGVETVLRRLGVLPFDEAALPAERPEELKKTESVPDLKRTG